MQALNFEQILERICKETAKSEEEIKELVSNKKAMFSGLLTDTGAAFMVAKEFGLQLDANASFAERKKINELNDGMKNVDVLCRVKQVFSAREFEKGGKKGRFCSLLVDDENGEIRLTVWNNQIEEIVNANRGSILLLKNAYVSSFNEKTELNVGFAGQVIFNPNETLELQELEGKEFKLNELEEGMENVDVFCRVLEIYPIRFFEKESRKGKVINFQIGDETKVMRAAAWNDLANIVNSLNVGDLVKVEGGYTKKGLQDIELNLGWNARILKDLNEGDMPSREELLGRSFERKGIDELNRYDKEVEVCGNIIGVRRGKLHYAVCPKCNKKVQEMADSFVCQNCGEVKDPVINPVITILMDDGKGVIQSTFFGRAAEKVIGKNSLELKKELEEKQVDDLIKELENRLSGKKITVIGNVQENSLNPDELEVIAKEVKNLKLEEEKKEGKEEFTGNEVPQNI